MMIVGKGEMRGRAALEAEIRASMEDEIYMLYKSLDEKNGQLQATTSTGEKCVGCLNLSSECDNNVSRGDSSFHEIYHSKDADTPIVEIPANFNEDKVSNSNIQIGKPCPTDSEYSRGLPVQRQCANANGMQDDCGTPVTKNDRMEPGPLQKKDGSSPGDLPVESPSRVDFNNKGGDLETPSASVCFNKGMLLQVHAQMDFFCFVEGGMLTVWLRDPTNWNEVADCGCSINLCYIKW
ncbi:hypothetical protein AgCh_026444 [Apium graveolens]